MNKLKYLLLGLLFTVLIVSRIWSYWNFGEFGFGFDYGIYKAEFERLNSFKDVLAQQIYFLPSFLALVFNKLGLPLAIYMDYFYLFCSISIGGVISFIAYKKWGYLAAVLALGFFTVSFAQLYGSQFYIFKAILGAPFFLLGFYLYSIKSYWFLLAFSVLALIQLPQALVLGVASFVSSFFDFSKNRKFVTKLWLVYILVGILFLVIFRDQLLAAVNLVVSAIMNVETVEKHQSGLFITFAEYFYSSYWILLPGLSGLITAFLKNKKENLVYFVGILFLLIVIGFKLFFEERYIFELDLLLLLFAAYFVFEILSGGRKIVKFSAWLILIVGFLYLNFYNLVSARPTLTDAEVWAIESIKENQTVDRVLVVNSFYATWMYGFSDKIVMSPGMFENVWSYDEYVSFISNPMNHMPELKRIHSAYGDYLLFLGVRDTKLLLDLNANIKPVFNFNQVEVYLVDF